MKYIVIFTLTHKSTYLVEVFKYNTYTYLHRFNSSSPFDWNNCIRFIVDRLRYKYCIKMFDVELRNEGK